MYYIILLVTGFFAGINLSRTYIDARTRDHDAFEADMRNFLLCVLILTVLAK
jgi:hypothetical protein